jgi:peptidoglycan/xylan/chitin deacetylase (PgdA/CDA1 family)
LFANLGVADSPWFRPPKGRLSTAKLIGLWWKGQVVVLWNHDVRDYQAEDVETLRERFRESPICSGDIVLLHDNQRCTANALSELIADTRKRGVDFGTPLAWLPSKMQSSLVATSDGIQGG